MKKIATTLMMLTIILSASAQNKVDGLISEMPTNFSYSPDTYYTFFNKETGAKLGISFDYNIHASAFHKSAPTGITHNNIIILLTLRQSGDGSCPHKEGRHLIHGISVDVSEGYHL